jgi:Asp-tRNA(Asn)/Glu-tRNA(Gln) amidotransferase B subunit
VDGPVGGATGAGTVLSGGDEPRARPIEEGDGPRAAGSGPDAGAAGAGKPPLPDVPPEKRGLFEHLQREHGLGEQEAAIVATDEVLTRMFDQAVAALPDPRAIANWLVNDLRRELKERDGGEPRFGGAELAELIRLVDRGEISTAAAKEVLGAMVAGEGGAAEIVAARGLGQVSDPAQLAGVVDEVLAAHPGEAEAYRGGKTQLLGFFIGQAMRTTRGRANPEVLREVLQARLRT